MLPITATKDKMAAYANIVERMRVYGVPGLSIAVIDGGRIVWAKGYGVANTRTGKAVTTDTLFQAASISKALAALGALVLVEHGKLGLDDDVNRYLRSWKVPANAFTAAHPVTLRTLLDHSAGFNVAGFSGYKAERPIPTLVQILNGEPPANTPPIRVESIPGDNYRYSGGGYMVLQQLLIDVSGKPFDSFIQSVVFRPLGMSHSDFQEPLPGTLLPVAARAHYAGGEMVPGGYSVAPELAAAGLWTTPSDLARYIVAVQQWNRGSRRGLISPQLTRQMLSPQIGFAGLGTVISGRGKDRRFGHDGFNEGFESSFVGYVHHGKDAIVMANSGFAYMLIKE